MNMEGGENYDFYYLFPIIVFNIMPIGILMLKSTPISGSNPFLNLDWQMTDIIN